MTRRPSSPGLRRRNGVFVVLLALASAAQAVAAQDGPGAGAPLDSAEAPFPYAAPEDVGLSTESLTELAALVRGWTRDTVIVGAEILVVKDGRTVLHEAAGWKDLEVGEPMRRNSIFRLLAMTKPFTATAALMLVEDGLLELEASVSRWLPSWANERSGEVTVRQLLTHTGGWEQYGTPRPLESYESLRDMVDDAGEHGPQHRPGEAYRYSDVHSYALGALVEEVSGVPVERFIEERILEPLDLVDTHTRFVSDTAWVDRVASRYRLQDDGWEKVWSPEQPQADPFFRASGGLFSTVTDYARWLEAWMGWIGAPPGTTEAGAGTSEAASPEVPRLLSKRTARAAVTPAVGPYGFHWEVLSDDPLVFGHGGVDGTHAMAIPSLDVMVVYLTQSQGREMRGRWPRAALDAVAPGLDLRRPLASVPAEKSGLDVVELTLAQRARYAGRYRAGSFTVRIFEEGGRLQRRLPTAGAPAVTLVPLGDHTFAMGRHEGDRLTDVVLPLQRLRFVVEDGRATALELVHGDEVRAVLQRLSPAAGPKDEAAGSDTVHVAAPTRDMEDDRASILEAFGEVQPGGTVQFAPGTYLIGDYVRLTVPRVTLQGHPDGTTIRGCDPDDFAEGELEVLVFSCNGFELAASHQTIRGLVFEHVWHGLYVGCCYPEDMEALQAGELPDPDQPGGHLIEDNRFRSATNGMRVLGPSAVTDPGRVPVRGRPGNAIGVFPQPPVGRCGENVVAGNRIEGYADAILLNNYLRGTRCQGNVVADNTIAVGRVPIRGGWGWQGVRVGDELDSTVVGVPLAVADLSVPGEVRPGGPSSPELPPGFEGDAIFRNHRIEGNRILGAEGIGIEIRNSSGNRIADNVVTGVEARDPFPGNLTHGADPAAWREANGSGIWISPGSEDNEIAGNTFEDVAGAAVFLEGDDNRVELRSASDRVRDLGTGNDVVVRASAEHEMHLQSPDLKRIMDAAMRATIPALDDASPIPAPTATHAIEALDHAGITYGLALSGGYFWGSPSLRSPRMAPILDSLGLDIGDARGRVRAENLYLAEQVARYPNRLVGACSVNPLASYALEELELCAADPRITAFSLNLAPAPVDFRDETHVVRLRTFFEALARTDLPVIVHMRNRSEGYGAGDAGVFIREVLAAAPGVPVQVAHMAGWGPYDEATDSAMQAFVDAFEDGTLDRDRFTFGVGVLLDDPEELDEGTATTRRAAERNTRLAERMRQVGIERVVVSTDWPFFPPDGEPRAKIARNRARLRNVLPLEPEELDRFFSNVGPEFRHLVESHSIAVRVAPPTGAAETDRASILAALEEVEPGGTVQFAPGTYLVGKGISVAVPEITLVAHPRGTTIRGCRPDDLASYQYMLDNCWGLELAGRDQTIRGFVFEHAFWALHLGCCIGERIERRASDGTLVEVPVIRPTAGGYLVEDNVFRSSRSGLRVNGVWEKPAVVRGNRFLNNWHSASIHGGPVHLLDNDISAPEPERVPFAGVPWDAVSITPGFPGLPAGCDGNVIAGNRIEGVPDGIKIQSAGPDARCRHNVVRDNTIRLRRVRVPPRTIDELGLDDTTMVMVPVAIRNLGGESLMENNLIEGNRILGAEGLAIEVLGASENRIVDNTISRVLINDRAPETTPLGQPTPWRQANGSAIWLSSGSDRNQILDNTFEDIAGAEVFLEGHDNRVELRSGADAVRDLGTGNRVSGPGGSAEAAAPPLYESKFLETRGIRLQYMDFGGTGLPVIFVQDFHDYFSLEEEPQHAAWLSRFADDFRVLAPVRRGYGESDDTGWGYDVATQSMDLLGLMDALGIRRAVLVGRNAATQDMTWIAEHHPERLAGLVYLENPLVFPDYRDPLVRTYAEMYWRGTCDLGAGDDAIARTGPRAPWRPHFLYAAAARIDVPALRFFAPQIESRSVDLRRLDRLAIIAASDHCGDEPAGRAAIRDFRDPHIRSFLEDVALREAARQPGPARDPERRE